MRTAELRAISVTPKRKITGMKGPKGPGAAGSSLTGAPLQSARQGRESIWALDPARLAEAHQALDQISAQWDVALERLRQFVEK